jgi:hypothetical protein
VVDWLADGLKGLAGLVIGATVQWWRDHRSERDERIDDLIAAVEDMAELGRRYWGAASTDETLRIATAGRIKAQSKNLSRLLRRLSQRWSHSFVFEGNDKLTAFRRAVTGGPFEVIDHPSEPERHYAIDDCMHSLIDAIREARRNAILK